MSPSIHTFLRSIYCLATYGVLTGSVLFCGSCKPTDPTLAEALTADQLAIVQGLDRAIIPIQDADPTRGFDELAPLDTVLAKAQIVAMGEGTHGTRDFFLMKTRLFRYLVQQQGHRAIAFEANFGRCVLINRYIHGQISPVKTATDAAKSMYFWTWATTEVRDLIEWMRQYNVGKPVNQQISFYGFDCQFADDEYPLVTDFVAEAAPDSLHSVNSHYSGYSDRKAGVLAVYRMFVANENKWVATGGRMEYEIAKQAARVLVQQQDLTANGSCRRDQYMAENVQWVLTNLNGSKVSLWAHNHHVANWSAYCGLPMMGAFLKKQLKDKYLTVGTSLSNGSFKAVGAGQNGPFNQSVRAASIKNSFNYLLGKARYPNFIFNLNQTVLDSSVANWINTTHAIFEPGAGYNERMPQNYCYTNKLKGRYDVLVHFRDTTPTQLLR